MRLSLISLSGVLLAALCSTALAQPAADVKCGTIVTSNITLAADMDCPMLKAGQGALVVVAPGITVDLNGHAVRGHGSGAGGIVVAADGVTIKNGEVSGFGAGVYGVAVQGKRTNAIRVERIQALQNGLGIGLNGASFGVVSECELTGNGVGVWLSNGENNVVSDNLVYGNANEGIVAGCEPSREDPVAGAPSACNGKGADNNVIERNAVVGNGWMKGPNPGAGITIGIGSRNTARDNLVMDNNTSSEGGQLNKAAGIVVLAGADNVIANNNVSNNGMGIVVTAWFPSPTMHPMHTAIRGNTVLHSASSGIRVEGDGTSGTVIRDNIVIANGYAEKTDFPVQCRSGIRVIGPGVVSLMNNRAYDNVGYGFRVETKDVTTQFGNVAKRNRAADQCTGVTCK